MVEPLPSNDARLPDRSMMSACEVITWIAFRRAIPSDGLSALFRASHNRWGIFPADLTLAALEARAGLVGDGPFHPVWIPNRPRSRDEIPNRDRILTPEGPAILRSIRARLRRDTGRLLGYAELAAMLRDDIEADARLSSDLQAARDELRDRAAGGLITVHGIPRTGPGLTVKSPLPEAVPASLFMHPAVTITVWNEVQPDTSRPLEEWLELRLPEYEQVQFRTAEVLALWPVAASARSMDAVDGVALADLPAAWTLTECVAWIMLRDPSVVRNLANSADQAVDEQAGQNACLRLDLRWTLRNAADPSAEGCDCGTGRETLLAALRSGHVHASGCLSGGALEPIPPAEWRALNLHEGPGGYLAPAMVGPMAARPWNNITIPRDAIVALWPFPRPILPGDPSGDGAAPAVRAEHREQQRVAALAAMTAYAEVTLAQHGKPPKRDDVARDANRRTGYPVRECRKLYQALPQHLRNHPRRP